MKKVTILITVFLLASISQINAQDFNLFNKSSLHLKALPDSSVDKNRDEPVLFNYNPVINRSGPLNKDYIFKNIVTDQSSIFVAFFSKPDPEKTLIKISSGNKKIFINNRGVKADKVYAFKNNDQVTGVLLSYLLSMEASKRNNYISFKDFLKSEESFVNMLEVFYFPSALSVEDRMKIESYLSIKYGISLDKKNEYVDSQGNILWDSKHNEGFNNRVTGIGRDDSFGLYQKQSSNSKNQGLIISTGPLAKSNVLNQGVLSNQNFILWGDNDYVTEFIESGHKQIEKIGRKWIIQTIIPDEGEISAQISLVPEKLNPGLKINEDEILWLAEQESLEDSVNIKLIKGRDLNDSFVFNLDKKKSENSLNYFSFLKTPQFFALCNVNTDNCKCPEGGNIHYIIYGGTPPYSITLESNNYKQVISTKDTSGVFSRLSHGEYEILVTDALNNQYSDFVRIPKRQTEYISLQPLWTLNHESEAVIAPTMESGAADIKFTWLAGNQIISEDSVLIINQPGEYIMKATDAEGCIVQFGFKVLPELQNCDNVTLYPNPVLSGYDFKLNINLPDKSEVQIKVCDAAGQIIDMVNPGEIDHYVYSGKIMHTGNYFIGIKINGRECWQKLVVN